MRTKARLIKKRRIYSEEFKCMLVGTFEKGELSVPQMEKLYNIPCVTIYRWIYKYSKFNERGQRVVEFNDSTMNKLQEYENRIKELERLVGQKQIKIEYLEKMIDIAKEELDIDIKKNSDTPHSIGSDKTKSN